LQGSITEGRASLTSEQQFARQGRASELRGADCRTSARKRHGQAVADHRRGRTDNGRGAGGYGRAGQLAFIRLSRLDGLNGRFNPAKEVFVRNIEVGMTLYAKPNKETGGSVFINPTVNLVLPDLLGIQDDLAG